MLNCLHFVGKKESDEFFSIPSVGRKDESVDFDIVVIGNFGCDSTCCQSGNPVILSSVNVCPITYLPENTYLEYVYAPYKGALDIGRVGAYRGFMISVCLKYWALKTFATKLSGFAIILHTCFASRALLIRLRSLNPNALFAFSPSQSEPSFPMNFFMIIIISHQNLAIIFLSPGLS